MSKILLVDDSVELCDELAEIFRAEGYIVDHTSDSAQGAGLIKKNRYDAAVFDYKMNGLNGIDLLRLIKETDPRCPVMIVSGMPSIEKLIKKEKAAHLLAGIIHKPFDIGELLQKLRSILSARTDIKTVVK